MPAPTDPGVSREGDALRVRGDVTGERVPALWRSARPQCAGVRRIDIAGVTRIDSAGLALLSALADAAGSAGIEVVGSPPGLSDLRAAYRLDAALGFGT